MSTMIPPPPKRKKRADEKAKAEMPTMADAPMVVVQFKNSLDNTNIGPRINLPSLTSRDDMQALATQLNSESEEKNPFAFYLKIEGRDRIPITQSIFENVLKQRLVSSEDVLIIECEPEATFRVRQVTRCTSTLSGHSAAILYASFSPNGMALATGSGDNTCRIWDLGTETPKLTLKGHRNWVLNTEWSGYGDVIATGSMDNSVRLWDAKTGNQLGGPLVGHQKWITSLSWEPIHLLDNPTAVPRLASSSKDGTVRVWRTDSQQLEFTLGGHTASVNQVKWGGKGVIYTASSDRSVRLWDSKTGKLIRILNAHAHWVNTLALNSDFILRTGPFDHKSYVTHERSKAWEIARERYEKEAPSEELLVSGSDDNTLLLWAPLSESNPKKPRSQMLGHQKVVNHVAFSPNGRLIASAGFDNAVRLWDGSTGKFIATLRGHVAAVYRLSWSADSRLLISASKDSTLKLWDLNTKKIKIDLPGHEDEVYCVDFVADKVASGGRDGKVKIWRN